MSDWQSERLTQPAAATPHATATITTTTGEEELKRPLALSEKGPSPPFGLIAETLDLIDATRTQKLKPTAKGAKKQDIISNFFRNYREQVGLDLLPVVRLLVPDRDRQRNTYGVKEAVLAGAFVDALGLNKNMVVAQKLINWKAPTQGSGVSGDFASVAKEVIQARSMVTSARGKLTIQQVNDHLDDLAKKQEKGERTKIIQKLYTNMTANELKWVIRIILKDLKISFRERTVLHALHPDAIDLFNVCSDLKRVCWTLYDPSYRLPHEDAVVKLFMPFKPMLSKRHENDFGHIVKLMGTRGNDVKTDGFVMEEKLDGERIQLHKRGQEYRYFSRRDHDYTYLYGKSRQEGSLTPWIDGLINDKIEEIILDGEMLVWEPALQKVLPFGTLKTWADPKKVNSDPWQPRPVFKVFDVLYAKGKKQKQGQNLLSKPYKNRREALTKFTKEEKGRLEWAEARVGKSSQDIVDYLEEIMNQFGEGLVIKHPLTPYVLNDRSDSWIKVKPDYMLGEGENLELLVMGGFWGSGKRGGGFGSFMCGLLDDTIEEGDIRLLSFAKFGSGLSMDILEDIKKRTEGKWRVCRGNPPPPSLVFGNEKPDEWIAPEDSFVVSVKAGDIVLDAAGYGARHCLRFPRLARYHHSKDYDKELANVTKYKEYIDTHRTSTGAEKRKLDAEGWSGRTTKKVKTSRSKTGSKFAETFAGADVSGMSVSSNIFRGLQFWIVEGNDSLADQSKNDLEKAVFQHGGDYQQSLPTQKERVVISGRKGFFVVDGAIRRGADIISPQWIIDSIKAQRRKPFSSRYAVCSEREAEQSDESDAGGRSSATTRVPVASSGDRTPPPPQQEEYGDNTDNDDGEEQDPDSDSATEEEPIADADSEDEGLRALDTFTKRLRSDSNEEVDAALGEDPDTLFDHFYFFLDTEEGLALLQLQEGQQPKSIQSPFWSELAQDIKSAGGTIVEHDDFRLTHVVLDESDLSRARTLQKLISKQPRARNFVKHTWVYDSIGACHQKDEFDYRPI